MEYSQRYWLLYGLFAAVLAAGLVGALYAEDFPNCTQFGFRISQECCCTNNCCSEAEPGEFRHISGDDYQSTVTGQFVKRKGYSADGRFIKCACTMGAKGWFKHHKATVFCIFPPPPSA